MSGLAMLRERVWPWIDIPPAWLGVFALIAWAQSRVLPLGAVPSVAGLLAGLLVGGGLLLALLALVEMRGHRTTPIPHHDATSLVMSGIYRRSRNPIYLGDLLILSGLVLYWGAWPSLILVPGLAFVLTDRFISREEAFLNERFGRAFEDYCQRTRRWL